MLRALGFLSPGRTVTAEEGTRHIVFEALKLEKALKAMDYVLDDRPKEAFRLLEDHDEVPISQLAYGVCEFLEATLGFEEDTMKHAAVILTKAEGLAWKEKGFAEKNRLQGSEIYPAGTEYTVVYAEANLLNALLMLMTESFVEQAKALLKLRRAYHALDSISKSMQRMNKGEFTTVTEAMRNLGLLGNESTPNLQSDGSSSSTQRFADVPHGLTEQQLQDREVVEGLERIYRMRKARIAGSHIGNPPAYKAMRTHLGMEGTGGVRGEKARGEKTYGEKTYGEKTYGEVPGEQMYGDPEISSVDEYIHSGVNLCFGILQVVLSLLPPGLGKVLSVVGFKGSREKGLRMIWKAAQERNVQGGIALLALLVFYDGPFQFTDVAFDLPPVRGEEGVSIGEGDGGDKDIGDTNFKDKNIKDEHTKDEHTKDKNIQGDGNNEGESNKGENNEGQNEGQSNAGNDKENINKEVPNIRDQNDKNKIPRTTPSPYISQKMELERKATAGQDEPTILHPGDRLVRTLLHARAIFPRSNLWLLQESRMLAGRGRLEEAVQLLDSAKPSQMRQVDALMFFDRCMLLVFLHRFDRAAKEFLHLMDVNTYSHALYTYFAGACYLEAYRMCETGLLVRGPHMQDSADPAKREEYRELARKYLLQAPELAGKKTFMAHIPPFEKLICRKHREVQRRARQTGMPYLDCIGTSPIHELAYFWDGYNRMPEQALRLSVKLLGYTASQTLDPDLDLLNSRTGKPYAHFDEPREQSMMRHTLQAVSLRRLGQIHRGNHILDRYVIRHISLSGRVGPAEKLRKLDENPWLYPTALYEKALFCWNINGVGGLDDSVVWLRKSQDFGGDDYELSTRVSMKTKAALDRLEDMQVS